MIKTVEKISKFWHSYNPSGYNKWCTHISGFVDDARVFDNLSTKGENLMDICTKLQDVAQSWDNLLTTSDGKLNTEKYAVYICIIGWNLKDDGTPTIDNISNYQIQIISSTD